MLRGHCQPVCEVVAGGSAARDGHDSETYTVTAATLLTRRELVRSRSYYHHSGGRGSSLHLIRLHVGMSFHAQQEAPASRVHWPSTGYNSRSNTHIIYIIRTCIDPGTGRVTEHYANAALCRLAGGASVPEHLARVAARALPEHVTQVDYLCRFSLSLSLLSLSLPLPLPFPELTEA